MIPVKALPARGAIPSLHWYAEDVLTFPTHRTLYLGKYAIGSASRDRVSHGGRYAASLSMPGCTIRPARATWRTIDAAMTAVEKAAYAWFGQAGFGLPDVQLASPYRLKRAAGDT